MHLETDIVFSQLSASSLIVQQQRHITYEFFSPNIHWAAHRFHIGRPRRLGELLPYLMAPMSMEGLLSLKSMLLNFLIQNLPQPLPT